MDFIDLGNTDEAREAKVTALEKEVARLLKENEELRDEVRKLKNKLYAGVRDIDAW